MEEMKEIIHASYYDTVSNLKAPKMDMCEHELTYHGNGYSGDGKGVANDVAQVNAFAAVSHPGLVHFP